MLHSNWSRAVLLALLFATAPAALAQADLRIDTPAIAALRTSLRESHQQLRPLYEKGAVGLTRDGSNVIEPLSSRSNV